jgi:VanZ family protein
MAEKKNKILKFWVPVLIWTVVIFLLSSIPGDEIPKIEIPGLDKLVHFLEFLILGILLVRAFFNSSNNMGLVKIMVFTLVAASSLAFIDEWHQHFIAGRTPDILDFMVDLIGSNVGMVIYGMKRPWQL